MDRERLIAWIDPAHTALVSRAASLAGLAVAAAGTPARGESQAVADALGAEPAPDLRAAVASAERAVVLITTAADPARSTPALDHRTLLAAEGRGVRLATTVPFPASLMDAAEGGLLREQAGLRAADLIRVVPRVRHHPAYQAAAEVIEAFGPCGLLTVEATAALPGGGLASAWLTAIDATLAQRGLPELVDAASSSPAKHLGELEGDLAALFRFPDGGTAQVSASSHGGWGWRVALQGPAGRLTLRTSGFDWFDRDGARRDEHRADERWRDQGEVLAAALRELADASTPQRPAAPWGEILATADAALLSTRTGQPESPGTMQRAASSAGATA
jgi:hypothetical protein